MINEKYFEQVRLLLSVLPVVAREKCFALKGGTAINMFYNNLPRLSVDLDLTYIFIAPRDISYQKINQTLMNICASIQKIGYSCRMQGVHDEKKLICSNENATVKIEPNYTIRGTIEPTEIKDVCEEVEKNFSFAKMNLLSRNELYAGKICAALDRQHPRDLFDIHQLFNNGGITDSIMDVFIFYLLGHNRPTHELLDCKIQDRKDAFENEFTGMTDEPFTYENHIQTLQQLKSELKQKIQPYSKFLLDFLHLNADFEETKFPLAKELPSIKWKMQNLKTLEQINSNKFLQQSLELEKYFSE